MKKKLAKCLSFLALFFMMGSQMALAKSDKGLLILAHGSHSKYWNEEVGKLETQVASQLDKNAFSHVRVAFMEMAKPTIADVIRDLEKDGVQIVFALPLFIASSGHSLFDIPAILGLYSEPGLLHDLDKEGIEIVEARMKIVLGPTLNFSDLMQSIMADRVRALSENPGSEGLVVLAHGSPEFEPIWYSICQKVAAAVCAETAIPQFEIAMVEVGQSFHTEGIPAILNMAGECDRTIVAGLYLSLSSQTIATRYLKKNGMSDDWFADKNIVFTDKALLPDSRMANWIIESAMAWSQSQNGQIR